MLGKRPRPMIGKLSELLVSGNKPTAVVMDVVTSPRSPLDLKSPSPRCLKRSYDVGGVGLGIVAALEKSGGDSYRHPVVVNSGRNCDRIRGKYEDLEMESFTYVTSHKPGKSSCTRVYYDGGSNKEHDRLIKETKIPIQPATATAAEARFVVEDDDVPSYPTSDFLSSCHLCRKKLHGKDIYMYRGEKAFCSSECRSTQIMMDERKEQKCRSEASRSAKVSTSPYNSGQIFSTGILAI
ncbi:hypothetical protein CCACVL1_20760 [Corchorus capsularis]|uniref:FLZ-type domain-containing protein n=1 Tax=Corchorus capsularis TaxID=210143 RepID=A0A1R3H9X2_COCAP|nr:hypothetical protein CCACVL1_20760 [Corchorus capsularis]